MTGSEIRETFLRYFEEREHRRVRSSSLVPQNDPSLFFTNAGMVQFKDVFLGLDKRDYRRAASTQKCMRVSGKHNDLENVGRTARHHTFFEMLGNFSFGDYFKREAIGFGWEFLTSVVGLDPDRLLVTVFREDDEAHLLWQEVTGIPADRIHRLGEKDNFWAMGDTGPCGPCSEILIDQGQALGCGSPDCGPECDCGRFLELWNLVFMQYNRDSAGALTPLPRPSIDTGMGLERLAAVLQGEDSNYHTDLVFPFLQEASRLSGVPYGASEEGDVSLRVIADHVRAATFLVTDGVLPSNEGRGYVLRRIMRRAMRHGKRLGMDGPFLNAICPLVGERLGGAFPEVSSAMGTVVKVVQLEEERFARTLDQGLRRLSELVEEVKREKGDTLPGGEVFRLYDTFGFPLDLSQDVATEAGLRVDTDGFAREMQAQKERARASWAGSGAEKVSPVYRALSESCGQVVFTGYDEEETDATIVGLASGGRILDGWQGEGEIEVVLDRTPFYGEGGGQVGDRGILEGEGWRLEVTDTIRPMPDLIVHRCRVPSGSSLRPGERCRAAVDSARRAATRRNHTATHLLHAALHEVLGDHVKQAGSLVEPSHFRFDLTHFAAMGRGEIEQVEDIVNRRILENIEVQTRVLPLQQAVEQGAMALFGEKYAEMVRTVSVPGVSLELCGGTHVGRTGDIGLFKVVAEGSVAAGVRRITGVTGTGVMERLREEESLLGELAASVKATVPELPSRLSRLIATVSEQERKIRELQRGLTVGGADLVDRVREVNGIRYLAAEVPGQDAASLRETADRLRDRLKSGVVVLGSRSDGKAFVVCVVTPDLTKRIPALEMIRRLSPIVGGGGGGRADMAQAGGKDPERLPQLMDSVEKTIKELAECGSEA